MKIIRQTIKEIHTNVAYRWYLGYGFFDKVPHFGTFSKNYTRRFYDNKLFEEILILVIASVFSQNGLPST